MLRSLIVSPLLIYYALSIYGRIIVEQSKDLFLKIFYTAPLLFNKVDRSRSICLITVIGREGVDHYGQYGNSVTNFFQ